MKKTIYLALFAMMTTACGASDQQPATPCTVHSTDTGIEVTCPDGSKEELVTPASPTCTVEQIGNGALITCPDGSQVTLDNGVDGQPGADGVQGEDGHTPDVTVTPTDASDECPYGGYELQVDGTATGTQICQDRFDCTTVLGQIEINSDVELEMFRGCEEISHMHVSNITSLEPLSNLRRVEQLIVRVNNDVMETLSGMESLEYIGQVIQIHNAYGLTDLSALSGLSEIEYGMAAPIPRYNMVTFFGSGVDPCEFQTVVDEYGLTGQVTISTLGLNCS